MSSSEMSARTVGISQTENEKCVEFCWIVKDFSKITSLKSPEFDGGESSKVKWSLKLNAKDMFDEKEYIGIRLYLAKGQNIGENNNINVYYDITLHINEIIKKLKTKTYRGFSNEGSGSWGWNKFMKTPSSVQNDQIIIECKIILKNTNFIHKIIGSSEYQNNGSEEENFKKLRSDYSKIFQKNEHSDFEIQVQDETFKVHKAILSARSEVFSAMFSSPMQESINSSVKIEDFNEKIVENMLEFIYTGKTDILESNVQELLKIADKYDLPDLKTDCENYLITNLLNNENCVLLLELADSFNASKLKDEAINFIIKFKNEVSQTAFFQNLMKSNGTIGGEILMAEWSKNLQNSNEVKENKNERKRKREE